jgi:hypothetical protein
MQDYGATAKLLSDFQILNQVFFIIMLSEIVSNSSTF